MGNDPAAEVRAFLESRGASSEEIREAEESGTLSLLVLDKLLFPRRERYDEKDLLGLVGAGPEIPRALWRAMGFPAAAPGEHAYFDDDLIALRTAMEGAAASGLSLEEAGEFLVRQTRLMSASLARIAEQSTDDLVALFDTWRSQGLSDAEIAELLINGTSVEPFRDLIWYMFRRQYRATAWRRLAVPAGSGRSAPTCVGFVDLVRFAAITEKIADDELGTLVDRFEGVAYAAIADSGGRVVKMIGDAVMFVAEEPRRAVRAALQLVDTYAEDDLLPPARAGLAYGPVLAKEGDYFGPTVNLAARVVDIARPSRVVIDKGLKDQLDDGSFTFTRLPPKRLKGIGSPPLWAVEAAITV